MLYTAPHALARAVELVDVKDFVLLYLPVHID
jgi:hypothetical protein